MNPDQPWLASPHMLLYLLNLALAASVVSLIGLLVTQVLRRRSAALRHALLVVVLMAVAAAPALVWLAQRSGSGLLHIAMNPSASRRAEQFEMFATDPTVPNEGTSTPLGGGGQPNGETGVRMGAERNPRASDTIASLDTKSPAHQPTATETRAQGRAAAVSGRSTKFRSSPTTVAARGSEPVSWDAPIGAPEAGTAWLVVGSMLALVWAAGIAAGTVHLLVGFGRLGRLRRRLLESAPAPLQQSARRAAGKVGLRRVPPVYLSPFVPTPIALGLLRAIIVLPKDFEEELSGQQLDAIFVHEAAHLARHDHWAALLGRVVTILYWWNPLVRRVVRRLADLCEEVCDDYVIASQAGGRPFAEALVKAAARVTIAVRLPAVIGVLDVTPAGLHSRVDRLLSPHPRRPTTRLSPSSKAAVIMFVLAPAAVPLIANVRAERQSQNDRETTASPAPAADNREAPIIRRPLATALAQIAADGQNLEDQVARALLAVAETLVKLGPDADHPSAGYSQPAPPARFGALAHNLARLPADLRYKLLERWTLPGEGRQAVRLLSTFVPTDSPPPEFGAVDLRLVATGGILSSADLLIESARAAGELDELADELLEAADAGAANAEALSLLVEIARGRGAEVRADVEQIVANLPAKLAEANRQPRYQPMDWTDLLLARACLRDPALRELGESYARILIYSPQKWSTMNGQFVTHAILQGMQNATPGPSSLDAGADPQLALWHPASDANSIVHELGGVPLFWSTADGEVRHDLGAGYDYLFFAYPLTGSFEFSANCYFTEPDTPLAFAPSIHSSLSYGGLVANRTMVWVAGMQDRFFPPSPVPAEEGFLRMTVQVESGRVRFLQDGRLYYEEQVNPASPWFSLSGTGQHVARFRNLELKGSPVIPREVHLTHENRLDGWISSFYFESQPQWRQNVPRKRANNIMPWAVAEHADWYAESGVIYGRKRNGPPEPGTVMSQLHYQRAVLRKFDRVWQEQTFPVQSRLVYYRPLRDGESLSYEFLFEPNQTIVHPSIGRLTFLLEPDAVRLHWITDTPYDDPTGLAHDNVVDVPHERRGPGPLPLRPGEWNQVTASLDQATVRLSLNGVEIYQRELSSSNSRRFGLFHWKDRSSVAVRNVVLRGDWPERLTAEQLADLTLPKPDPAGRAIERASIERPLRGVADVQRAQSIAKQIATRPGPTPVIWHVAFSPDGTALATAGGHWSNPGTARIWEVATGRELVAFTEPLGIRSVAFSSDGSLLAIATYKGFATVRELPSGDVRFQTPRQDDPVSSVDFSPDGKTLATACADGNLRLWDAATGERRATFEGHADRAYYLVFSPDGKRLLSGGKDRTARLWDTATGEMLHLLPHNAVVDSACFSPDGTKLLTGCWDGTARIWDAKTGKLLAAIRGDMPGVVGLAISPDGKIVATGSFGGTVKLWDLETAREIANLEGHHYHVYGVDFSPDGKLLATGSWDKTTRLWDVATGKQVAVLAPEGTVVPSTAEDE